MPESKRMAVQKAYLVMATMFLANTTRGAQAVVIQAAIDVGGENSEILQMVFKQIELLMKKDENESKTISQDPTELATALLQAAPSLTVKGNITDPQRRLTLTFTLQATRAGHRELEAYEEENYEEGWEDYNWRGSGGVFHPIVGAVEPYVLGFAELIFNGILSSVISNFLENSSLLGDVRLV